MIYHPLNKASTSLGKLNIIWALCLGIALCFTTTSVLQADEEDRYNKALARFNNDLENERLAGVY